jgi:F-type H+-transporting ATPase subunit b
MNLIPDWTVGPMWLIFISALVVLNTFVFKPTLAILAERRKQSVDLHKQAESLQQKAENQLKDYETRMGQARIAARAAREAVLKTADSEQKQVIAKAREQAEQTLSGVKSQISVESAMAGRQLSITARDLAQQLVKKLVA